MAEMRTDPVDVVDHYYIPIIWTVWERFARPQARIACRALWNDVSLLKTNRRKKRKVRGRNELKALNVRCYAQWYVPRFARNRKIGYFRKMAIWFQVLANSAVNIFVVHPQHRAIVYRSKFDGNWISYDIATITIGGAGVVVFSFRRSAEFYF